jgi:hypothetical protein
VNRLMLRILVSIVFFALIGALPILAHVSVSQGHHSGGEGTDALSQVGFRFQEVSREAGIDFTHAAPQLDPKLDHIMPEVASMGAGVSIVDYDRDGLDDIYVVSSGETAPNKLYRNLGNGRFEDVAAQVGLAAVNSPETGVSMGAIWGDYDNDGYEDVLVYKWGQPELYHNDRGQRFTPVGQRAGLPRWLNANSAVWFDYDRDGLLDLFIGGYYHEDLNLWKLASTRMMPESFEYAQNGGRKYLLRNQGNGTFRDVTEEVGLHSRRWALAAAAADLRGTGYPDLVIANDYGVSEFFANEGGKRFREIGKQTGIAERPKSGMNVAFGDIANRGTFAIYITNISEEGYLIQGNNLWVPREGVRGNDLRYDNAAGLHQVELGGWSFGAQFGDLNNDGYQDLFLTNGYLSADKDKSYWYDFAKVAAGNSTIIGDARHWPPVGTMSHSGYQEKRVWVNNKGRRFINVAGLVGVRETFDGRAVALADLWNRGALDVVAAHQRGPLLVYRNEVRPDHSWVQFELEGTASNRSAIGAEVRVRWNGMEQLQQVSGASGFCAQNQRRLHFGLGPGATIEKVTIRWPSGKEQTLTAPATGKLHRVKEPA